MSALVPERAIEGVDFNGRYALPIGGRLVTADDTFEVYNPATNEVLAHAPRGTAQDLGDAINSAADAFSTWSALPGKSDRPTSSATPTRSRSTRTSSFGC